MANQIAKLTEIQRNLLIAALNDAEHYGDLWEAINHDIDETSDEFIYGARNAVDSALDFQEMLECGSEMTDFID